MYKRPKTAQELADYFIEHLSFLNERNWSAEKLIQQKNNLRWLQSLTYKCLTLDMDWEEGHSATLVEARAILAELDWSVIKESDSVAQLIDGAMVVVDGEMLSNETLTDTQVVKAVLQDSMNLGKFIPKQ